MASKTFICKKESEIFYLSHSGMGGFLNPEGHAEHSWSISMVERGRESGSMSLQGAIESEWTPVEVKDIAKNLLAQNPGRITKTWIKSVYRYFRHCYSKDGINRNVSDCVTFGKFWDNVELEKDMPAENHLGYLFVKKFDQNHTPQTDLF